MKRMIISGIWEDSWFMELNTKLKLLWIYIITKIDQRAVWEVNLKLASFHTGETYELKEIKRAYQGKFIEIQDKYWFVPTFIKYHHGMILSRDSNFHKPVIEFVEQHNLIKEIEKVGISIKQGYVIPNDMESVMQSVRKYWRRLPSQYELELLSKLDANYLDQALRESSKYNKQSVAYVSAVIEGLKKKKLIEEAKSREEKARLLKIEEKKSAESPEAKEVFAKLFSDLKKELNIIPKQELRRSK